MDTKLGIGGSSTVGIPTACISKNTLASNAAVARGTVGHLTANIGRATNQTRARLATEGRISGTINIVRTSDNASADILNAVGAKGGCNTVSVAETRVGRTTSSNAVRSKTLVCAMCVKCTSAHGITCLTDAEWEIRWAVGIELALTSRRNAVTPDTVWSWRTTVGLLGAYVDCGTLAIDTRC